MLKTKHELSFNSVKLDYDALLKTAQIAFANTRTRVEEHLKRLQEHSRTSCYYLDAQWLERAASQLTIAAETMYTLEHGLERREVTIVNKLIVKEDVASAQSLAQMSDELRSNLVKDMDALRSKLQCVDCKFCWSIGYCESPAPENIGDELFQLAKNKKCPHFEAK